MIGICSLRVIGRVVKNTPMFGQEGRVGLQSDRLREEIKGFQKGVGCQTKVKNLGKKHPPGSKV